MKNHFLKIFIGAALLASPLFALAADIDLFLSQSPSGSSEAPNVLLLIDNGASFSANASGSQVCRIDGSGNVYTTGTGNETNLSGKNSAIEQCALYSVIKSLDTSSGVKVNIGVMFFNATGMPTYDPATNTFTHVCAAVSNNGGCLGVPITPLTAAVQTNLLSWIKNWTTSGNSNYNIKGPSSLSNGGALQESWAYFNGHTGLSGRNYSSIKPSSPCGKNYIIFVGNDYGNQASPKDGTGNAGPMGAIQGTNSTTDMNANPAATSSESSSISIPALNVMCVPPSGTSTAVTLSTAENKGAYGFNWARYMQDNGTKTYSVGITGSSCDTTYLAWLTELADATIGGGKFFQTNDYSSFVTALQTILGEIQAVNTVFAAVSLPVSVNTQGTYLNQVYVGMFRPDADALPRWPGNLKQYKLALVNNDIKLQDADSSSAINSSTGFITECARSYWTPNTVDSYWDSVSTAKGGCTAIANSTYSNYPDGNIVEKGAQAYQLRQTSTTTSGGTTTTSRTVKTCSTTFSTCSSTATLTSFDTSNSAVTASLSNTLINWARGVNTANELSKGTTVMRPSSHGDIVHSRPVAVNYGTDVSPSIVVYYGGNDGMLRAVNGNRGCTTNSTTGLCPPDSTVGRITSNGTTYNAGTELWAFMPPEFYSNIQRLYDDTVTINYPGSTVNGALPKPYGFDGPVTAFQGTISGSAKTFIYATMRRGGRVLYAFDVTTPGNPQMKWKVGCPNNFPTSGTVDDTNCSTGFTGIGQTWSSAKVFYASGYGSGTSPMIIIGGGYDTCEDTDDGTHNNSCTGSTKGNKIYVLNADTGALLQSFSTDRAVVGDVTLVTDTSTGMLKYAYATDMGGNVYRISGSTANVSIGATAPSTTAGQGWTLTKIASLGCDTTATCNANRKFEYAPDVVYDNGEYVILVGSGDREKPLSSYAATYAVTNYFFMIKDDPTNTTELSSQTATCGSAVICKASLYGITTSATPLQSDLDAKQGWYLALAAHEQVVTSSVSIFGTTTFSTHQPAVNNDADCGSNLGTTLVYNIAYTNAASENGTDSRSQALSGNGLPPSPVAGQVTLDSGQTVPFCIGCSASSPLEGKYETKPSSSSSSSYKSRVYWYIEK